MYLNLQKLRAQKEDAFPKTTYQDGYESPTVLRSRLSLGLPTTLERVVTPKRDVTLERPQPPPQLRSKHSLLRASHPYQGGRISNMKRSKPLVDHNMVFGNASRHGDERDSYFGNGLRSVGRSLEH